MSDRVCRRDRQNRLVEVGHLDLLVSEQDKKEWTGNFLFALKAFSKSECEPSGTGVEKAALVDKRETGMS